MKKVKAEGTEVEKVVAYCNTNMCVKINSGSLDKILIDRNMYYSLDVAKNETETITKVSIMTDNIYSSKGNDNGKNYVIDNNILITTHENKELLN